VSGSRSDSEVSSASMVPGLLTCGASGVVPASGSYPLLGDVRAAPGFQVALLPSKTTDIHSALARSVSYLQGGVSQTIEAFCSKTASLAGPGR